MIPHFCFSQVLGSKGCNDYGGSTSECISGKCKDDMTFICRCRFFLLRCFFFLILPPGLLRSFIYLNELLGTKVMKEE